MGNCWRMPEDHSGLLSNYSNPSLSSGHLSSTVCPSNVFPLFSVSNASISEPNVPKLVTLNQSSADLNTIKAAQCRNLLEHLPLIRYNEKQIKQTECDICLIDFDNDEFVRKLPCEGAHVFHPTCIDQWLEKSLTCPHCSTNVDAALLLSFIPNSNLNDDD